MGVDGHSINVVGHAVIGGRAARFTLNEAGLQQHAQMLGDIGLGTVGQRDQLADVLLAITQAVQQLQPTWLGQRFEHFSDPDQGGVVQTFHTVQS